ncbi:MAG TPA: Spy/CpxP family protein refolding chaperone [Pyrinomonadaceae bacterium]|nr:Spy/CpxP family protein refolding chaperone [Pyrinomonadaceae bacterium]
MKKFAIMVGALSIVLAGFVLALAQQPQAPATTAPNLLQKQGGRRARRMMTRRRARAGAIRELNLTDAQRQQAQAIRRENFEKNRAVRDELKQLLQKRQQGTLSETDQARARELRQQLHESRRSARAQLAGLLTEEQKTKLQEMRKNRRENRERFGRRGQNKPI